MSVSDNPEREATFELQDLPEFELSYLFDDTEHPEEITVFPGTNELDISTHWITIDADHSVPLEKVR